MQHQERASHSSDVTVYMESEIRLYEHIHSLKAIAVDPMQYYPIVLQQSVFSDLFVPLLLHDNVDIVIAVVALLLEWFDISIPNDGDDENSNHTNKNNNNNNNNNNNTVDILQQLTKEFFISGVAELIVDSCDRMMTEQKNENAVDNDENDDDDDEVGRGVEDVLSLFENLLDLDTIGNTTITISTSSTTTTTATLANQICKHTNFISMLFYLQQQLEDINDDTKSINLRQRSMELLMTITTREEIYMVDKLKDWTQLPAYNTTTADTVVDNTKAGTDSKESSPPASLDMDAIEIILQNIGKFRKRQPSNNEEMEYIENCCIVLTSILTYASASSITAFIERQGIELVIRCLKERVYAGATTLEWLDFHGNATPHQKACEYMVHIGVLKYIFPLLMGKHLPELCDFHDTTALMTNRSTKSKNQQMKRKSAFHKKIESTTIRILYSLVLQLQDNSPNDVKARFIAKFMEDDRKVQRLIDLYIKYDQQVRLAEYKFYQSDIEDAILEDAGDHYSKSNNDSMVQLAVMDTKLKAGGDIMYRLAAIIAFCCCTSKKCHTLILKELQTKQSGISIIKDTLLEFISMLDVTTDQRILLQNFHNQI